MSTIRTFTSFTEARANLRGLLDAASLGLITTVTREREQFVVQRAADRADELRRLVPSRAVVAAEGGGWAAYLPGIPVHGDANTFDAALDDLVVALRDYAADWNDRLHGAPNHAGHRAVVELVELSDDRELRAWLLADSATP